MVILYDLKTGQIIATIESVEYPGNPPKGTGVLIDNSKKVTSRQLLGMMIDVGNKTLRKKTLSEVEKEDNERKMAISRFSEEHPELHRTLFGIGETS